MTLIILHYSIIPRCDSSTNYLVFNLKLVHKHVVRCVLSNIQEIIWRKNQVYHYTKTFPYIDLQFQIVFYRFSWVYNYRNALIRQTDYTIRCWNSQLHIHKPDIPMDYPVILISVFKLSNDTQGNMASCVTHTIFTYGFYIWFPRRTWLYTDVITHAPSIDAAIKWPTSDNCM